MSESKLSALREYLCELACDEAGVDDEDFNPMDASGGNFDDAYNMGVEDGATLLARALLGKFWGRIE